MFPSKLSAIVVSWCINVHFVRLVPHMLAAGYPMYAARYLQRYLLNPPPYHIADHMRGIVSSLLGRDAPSIPLCPHVSIGKVVSLLSAGQANAATFREIAVNIKAMSSLLQSDSPIVPYLLKMATYDSGMAYSGQSLVADLQSTYNTISSVISLNNHNLDVPSRDKHTRIPDDFFYRNENDFRGSINFGMTSTVLAVF